jgi:hypothetical protein
MGRRGVLAEIRKRVVGHSISGVHNGHTNIDVRTMAGAIENIG